MSMNLFRQLAEGGPYSLPYLIRFYTDNKEICVINDTKDLQYKGRTYLASTFTYSEQTEGDADFEIEIADTDGIIDILDAEYNFTTEVVGIFFDGEVTEISRKVYKYGEATWSGGTFQMRLEKDDRMDMTFPALIFNADNNKGNT